MTLYTKHFLMLFCYALRSIIKVVLEAIDEKRIYIGSSQGFLVSLKKHIVFDILSCISYNQAVLETLSHTTSYNHRKKHLRQI